MKKVTNYEKLFIDLNERMQIALEVSSPDIIPKIIRNFKSHLLGFHYKQVGPNIVYHNDRAPNYSIPSSVKSVREACDYINSIQYDVKDTFAAVGYNDKYVAVSAHHMLCDGGLLKEAFENLLVNEPCQLNTIIPMNVADIFPNEIKNVNDDDIRSANYSMDNVTKLQWSKNHEELKKIPGNKMKCSHINAECPIDELNVRQSKMNLTDIFMSSYLLSVISLNGRIDSNYGISIPIDLRQFLPKNKVNFSNTQNTSTMIINAFNVNPKMSVRELSNILRKDLNVKMNNKTPFTMYKCFLEDSLKFDYKNCCYPELSNMGMIKSNLFDYKKEIKDVWIQTYASLFFDECLYLLTFSKMKNGKPVLCSRLRYPCSAINETDANLLMKSYLRMMKDVPIDASIQDAYDDLRKFQNKIIKNEHL